MILDEDKVLEITKGIVHMLKRIFELTKKIHQWKNVRLMKEI
jgi:hypothetical protein